MTTVIETPPGEDGFEKPDNLFARAEKAALSPAGGAPAAQEEQKKDVDWLNLVSQAETQGGQFMLNQIKDAWDRSYKAFHNQHFSGSKYLSASYKGRSKLFRPKTRGAVRKANAAAAAALFSTVNTINCSAGNENDPVQKANADLMQQLINYRTDRTSGKAAIPWFRIAIGAHQDTLIMSACLSKQYWKLELKEKVTQQPLRDEATGEPMLGEDGQPLMQTVRTFSPSVDRPDVKLIALENVIIDPAADWTDPVQSAAYFIVKYPMRIDEIRKMQQDPRNPWNEVPEATLLSAVTDQKLQASGTRAARENGQDRLDQNATGGGDFRVIWVYEVFMRYQGQDICFYSAGSRAYLTDPKPVEEVYPEQGGERPYVLGTGALESHRIFPMSHVEAWQPLQQEINDLANLRLDQVKQNVSPITFVKRGRQVDLGALQRRGPNSVILRTDADDIEFAQTPEVPSSAYAEMERLNVDFDDQAGQFNSGTVQTNRSLNETVGGMNLISASANSVQEFDLRTWVETWVEPVMGQLVRLEQYYESDKTILGLCADKAQLYQKHGISEITDELLMEQVTLRIDAGMGASNPQTKLGNLATAIKVIAPVWQNHPDVVSGRKVPNLEELTNEVFSLSGYRDGGKRFLKEGTPQQPNPAVAAEADKLKSEAEKNRSTAVVNQAKAQEIDARMKMDFAELVHGQRMDRAQLVNQVRTERENMQRDRVNDDRQQRNTEADREMRQRETELKNKPAEQPSGDLISELTALLQRYGANNGSMAAR